MLIRIITTSVAGLAAATAISVGVSGQNAPDSIGATSATSAGSARPAPRACEGRDRLPDPLRDDLQSLRDLPPGERLAGLGEIREGAKVGDYGPRVRGAVERRAEQRARVVRRLPDEFVADLRALRTAPDDERRAGAEAVRDRALAGDYGSTVQRGAERLGDRIDAFREMCPAS